MNQLTISKVLFITSLVIMLTSMILLFERADAVQECNQHWQDQLANKTLIDKPTYNIQIEVPDERQPSQLYRNNQDNNTPWSS